jgi:predicted nucleic acid-binding protein
VTRFVIDAEVLIRIAAGGVRVHPTHQLVAPSVLRSEALSRIYRAVRRGDLEADAAQELLVGITEVKIRLLGDRVSRSVAWKLAEEHGWDDTADAEYAAITRLQADALVALDAELRGRLADVVPLADLAALETA